MYSSFLLELIENERHGRLEHMTCSGVAVESYISAAGGDIMQAISLSLTNNPSAVRFVLPPGNWLVTNPLTELRGLRNNLAFDGLDPFSCRLYRTSTGQMFRWENAGVSNVAFFGIEFAFENPLTNYGASINGRAFENVLIERCRFVTTFTNQTDNGIYHGIGLHGGKNLVFRNNYQDGAQVTFGALGVSIEGATYEGNTVVNCNDYGVSAVSGNVTGAVIRDVLIRGNRMRGTRGGGYIYVGSDSTAGQPNPDMRDIQILDNICSGPLIAGFLPAESQTRLAINASLGHDNRRIRICGNQISNTNQSELVRTQAIMAFVRNADGGQTEDLQVCENQCDFTSGDPYPGIQIEGVGLKNVQIARNTIRPGTRGMLVKNASRLDIAHNNVEGAVSVALSLQASANAVDDVNIERNRLETTGAFKPGVSVSGTFNVRRCTSSATTSKVRRSVC